MDLQKFLEHFKEQFIDADEIVVESTTKFRDIGSWDSLTGMSILVMINDECDVDMKPVDLKKCETVQDVYDYILSKKAE
jgi:acyl carrier protein